MKSKRRMGSVSDDNQDAITHLDTARSEQALLEEKNMEQLIFDFEIIESQGLKALQLRKSQAEMQRRQTRASSASQSSASSSDRPFSEARVSEDGSLQIVEEPPQKHVPTTDVMLSRFSTAKAEGRVLGPGVLISAKQRSETEFEDPFDSA